MTAVTQKLAQMILDSDAIVVDTETTGLDHTDEVVEIGALGVDGFIHLDTLVKPSKMLRPFNQRVYDIHGHSAWQQRAYGKAWSEINEKLAEWNSEGADIAIFNASFDVRLITQTDHLHSVPMHVHDWHGQIFDVMQLANRHFHEFLEWNEEKSCFKRLSLARCCEIAGIQNKYAHTAISDCEATLELIKHMAEGRYAEGN